MPQKPAGRESRIHYDRSISTKRQFLTSVKRADIAGEQINSKGVTALVRNDVAASTGIYLDKGMQDGKPFTLRGALHMAESKWPMGMPCQPIDFDYALMVEDS